MVKKSIYRLDKEFKCEIVQHHELASLKFLYQDIEQLSYLYPNIKNWYWTTFAQGFVASKRDILCVFDNDRELAGFVLLKRTKLENKICTLYVLPEFRESGIGRQLLPLAVDLIGGKDIGITVSESVNNSLKPLLTYNNFEVEKIESGLYLPKVKEFLYRLQ